MKIGENMSINERFNFEKIGDYRKKIIDTNYKEIEKFDINRKLNKSFNNLLTKAAMIHFN